MDTPLPPIEGPAAWYGRDLARDESWIYSLGDTHLDEIASALVRIKREGRPLYGFSREDFPLHRTGDLLAEIAHELENGRGLVRLRGLDVTQHSRDDIRHIFWGLGCHLGTPLFQNPRGEVFGEVRDETRMMAPGAAPAAPGEGKLLTSRARARSTGSLRFHTDPCDVIALLCVNKGRKGGISKLASTASVYNEIRARRPDLAALLLRDYWRARSHDNDDLRLDPHFPLPVFGIRDGKLTSYYSRTAIELAQENPTAPRLTAAQNEALDLLAEVAEEVCLLAPFEAGDLQLLNNHAVYHARTAYEDDPSSHQERALFRLWLSMSNSRALPAGFDVAWGDIAPGALRGGVAQPDTGQRAPGRFAMGARTMQ